MKDTVKKLVVRSAVRLVKLDDIQLDTSYQRDVKRKHKLIVADFNEDALGIPVVGEREDGSLWMVDGLQRMTALKKLGHKQLRAEVFNSSGPEHEAEVFKLININRTKLSPQEEFKAMLTAGDAKAWAIKEAVESCGFQLLLRDAGGADKDPEKASLQVSGVSTLRRIEATEGESIGAIKFALNAIKECWPGDRTGPNFTMLGGMAAFYRRMEGVVDLERLYPRLKSMTPHKIIYSSRQDTIAGNAAFACANVLEKVYKKRLKKQ